MNIVFEHTRSAIVNDVECWLLDRRLGKQDIEHKINEFTEMVLYKPFDEISVRTTAKYIFDIPDNMLKTKNGLDETGEQILHIWIDFSIGGF